MASHDEERSQQMAAQDMESSRFCFSLLESQLHSWEAFIVYETPRGHLSCDQVHNKVITFDPLNKLTVFQLFPSLVS